LTDVLDEEYCVIIMDDGTEIIYTFQIFNCLFFFSENNIINQIKMKEGKTSNAVETIPPRRGLNLNLII